MQIERSAKLVIGLFSSAIVALIVAFVFAAISISGVASMNAAGTCLWVAFGIFSLTLGAVAVIYCPGKSGTKASLATLGLVLLLLGGLRSRSQLNDWLKQQKAIQLATAAIQSPPLPKPPTVPKDLPPQLSGRGAERGAHVVIRQAGNGNTANPVTVAAPISPNGPCDVVQIGGSQNAANPTCLLNPLQTYYEVNGIEHTQRAGKITATDAKVSTYIAMNQIMAKNDWTQLLKMANTQIEEAPEWPTPYYFAAKAEIMLCSKQSAVANFQIFIEKTKSRQDYALSSEDAKKLLSRIAAGELPTQCSKQP